MLMYFDVKKTSCLDYPGAQRWSVWQTSQNEKGSSEREEKNNPMFFKKIQSDLDSRI